MKVAIYCRVSTEDQNLDNQEIQLKNYCLHMNHSIYRVYKDVISGTTDSRPAFNQLLEDMRSFKFDCIIVTKLDRVGRSL